MKKIALTALLFVCCSHLFAQKDTVFFLYKGSMYSKHDSTLNLNIKKTIGSTGNVSFSVKGENDIIHRCTYYPTYNRKEFLILRKILMSPKVHFLNYLSELNDKEFVVNFGYSNYQSVDTIFFLVPLLDANAYTISCFEVSFFSEFLLPEE